MKFLLAAVNAKYIHSNPAIYSLRAYAGEELQENVELTEYTINQPVQEILADLYGRKPDVIGFSCYIWNMRHIQELLGEIPKLLPRTEIWLGGPEAAYDAPEILDKFPGLSGVMVGEGEATFRELLEFYLWKERMSAERPTGEAGESGPAEVSAGLRETEIASRLRGIAGLCLRDGYTRKRPPVDMTEIPFLYGDLAPFENRIIYYESGRGCPCRCSYCLSSVEKSLRKRDINVVKRELKYFLDHRVEQVKFVDRTFNCDHEHAMEIWRYLQEQDNGVTNFHFEVSADLLTEEEIALLNRLRPGLVQLEIGVQSTNPKTLREICRFADTDRLERAVASLRKGRNIHIHLDLIAGLPFEDYESFGRSFDRVCRMRPQQLQLGFLKVLKGTPIRERAAEYGIVCTEQPPYEVLYTNWLSYDDVRRLKGIEEMVELYYNSGQFRNTLALLEGVFESPFAMYGALADFYREEGYHINSPARAYRYRVLLDFAKRWDGERLDRYRELLVYDLYLRENLKSRPDFAPDTSGHREVIREFYRREERERRYLPDYGEYDRKQLAGMTHLEPFSYQVWDEELMRAPEENRAGRPAKDGGEWSYLLFDYQKRNPLNGEAAVQRIAPGDMSGA